MKKITLLFFAFCLVSWHSSAQFTESFDTEIPAAWTVLNEDGGTYTWDHQTQYPHAGAGHVRIHWEGSAHDDYLISPQFTVTSGVSDRVSFWAGIDGTFWTETFDVRISTTGTAAADFTTTIASETATTDADGNYTQYTYDLAGYDGQAIHVAIVATDTDRFYLYVDEFVVDTPPSCDFPVVTFTEVNDCSTSGGFLVSVDITDIGSASGVTITDDQGSTPQTGLTAGTYSVGPYSSGTNVVVTVTNDDDGACLVNSSTLAFSCPSPNDECADAIDLDSYMNPNGSCTTTFTGTLLGATNSVGEVAPSSECTNAASDPNPLDIWFSLTVPASGGFIYDDIVVPGASSIVEVYTGTCGTLTALTPVNCTNSSSPKTFDGLTPGSTVYLRYWDYGSDDEGDLEFCIQTTPLCPDPEDFEVSNIMGTSAVLSWTEPGILALSYNVEVYNTGESAANGDTPVFADAAVAGTTVTATGLSETTDYDAYITTSCSGSEESGLVGPLAFTTTTSSTPDWYNVQWVAPTADIPAGSNTSLTVDILTPITAYAQIWVDGVTDPAGQAAGIECWIGGHDMDTDPSTWPNDVWEVAAYNGDSGNNDEYVMSTTVDHTGSAYVAARWRYNGGPFVYGGYNGPWDGTSNNSIEVIGNPVANDDCSGAIELTVNADYACGVVTTGTVAGATDSGVTGSTCGGTDDDDVWYSFVATSDQHRVSLINISGSTSDMYHAVYDAAGGCGSLGAALICNDGNTSNLTGLTIGNTYYVQVYTWTSTAGQDSVFDVCVGTPPPPPANDDCANAEVYTLSLDVCSSNTVIDTSSATEGADELPSCDTSGNLGVWYTIEAPASGTVEFVSGTGSPGLVIYDGTCGSFTEVGCLNNTSGSITGLTPSTTYYAMVWTDSAQAAAEFCMYYLNCTAATVNYSVVNDCDNSGGFFVDVEITDMGSATDITVSDDQGSTSQAVTMTSTVQFGPYVNGTNVVITVSDDNDASCDQSSSALTQAACPPSNDDIASAISITVDEGFCDGTNTNGTNEAATDSMEANGSCFNGTAPTDDVWFTFTVPSGTATVDVSTDFTGGTLVDSEIAVYSGTPGSLVELACSQDDGVTDLSNGFSWNSLVTDLAVTVGENYYVQVAGYGSGTNQGTFCLDVSTNQVLSLEDDVFANFKYFPNPVNDVLSLRAQQSIQNVSVFNMLGQEVVRVAPNVLDADVDMAALQAGTYFVQVTINDTTETIKVIRK